MREKKNVWKKKSAETKLAGLLPNFLVESQYNKLYCDRQGLGDRLGRIVGAHKGRAGACMVGHDTAGWAMTRPGWWIMSRYTIFIMTEARGWPLGGCVTIQSLYRDRRAVWLAGVS